jgi:hypothetical protein
MADFPISSGLKSKYTAMRKAGTLEGNKIYICTDTGEQFLGKIMLNSVQLQIEAINNRKDWAGTFASKSAVPVNASGFLPALILEIYDYVEIISDESHGGANTRYIVGAIADNGAIAWVFDIAYGEQRPGGFNH